ncbi:MAG: hypothetical protein WCH86_01910 [Kiritimatiellales bacterium]
MIDMSRVHGTKFAIVAIRDAGTQFADWCMFTGTARWDGAALCVELPNGQAFPIHDSAFDRIKPAESEADKQELDGAEFFVILYAGNLPEDKMPREFENTGIKWSGGE